MGNLRICFAGTPDFAAAHLLALLDSSHQVIGVYTQPDRPGGRGNKLQPSPVKQIAEQTSIPLFQPQTLKTPDQQKLLAELEADVFVIVAYGLILPKPILTIPKFVLAQLNFRIHFPFDRVKLIYQYPTIRNCLKK